MLGARSGGCQCGVKESAPAGELGGLRYSPPLPRPHTQGSQSLAHSCQSCMKILQGCPTFLASLGHTRRRVVLGHTVNTLRHVITKKSHNVLSKLTTLCRAALTAILGCMRPGGRRSGTPAMANWEGRPSSQASFPFDNFVGDTQVFLELGFQLSWARGPPGGLVRV